MVSSGVVLDCHPTPDAVLMDVVGSSGTTSVGSVEYGEGFIRTIENAVGAYSALCDEGVFLRERQSTYSVKVRLTTFDEWEQYWADEYEYYVEPDPELFPTIKKLMEEPGAELILTIAAVGTRFMRLG